MHLMDFKDMGALSVEALGQEVVTCRRALFNLRFQQKTEASQVKSHQIRVYRRQIARLKTAVGNLSHDQKKGPQRKKAAMVQKKAEPNAARLASSKISDNTERSQPSQHKG